MDIKGKTALVTGAAGGIGREFVRELLERGASKVIAAGMNAVKAGNWPAGAGSTVLLRAERTALLDELGSASRPVWAASRAVAGVRGIGRRRVHSFKRRAWTRATSPM